GLFGICFAKFEYNTPFLPSKFTLVVFKPSSTITKAFRISLDTLSANRAVNTRYIIPLIFFFFQAEDGIRVLTVTGVQTCALPISAGLGFLYCRRDLVEQLRPTATGWFADADVFAMDIQDYSPAPDARRFQAGTPPIPSIYAGIAGIELMKEIGVAATRAHVGELNEALIAGVDELGGSIVTPRDPSARGALVAIRST